MNTIYKTLAFLVLLLFGQQATAQNFITQWNLSIAGSGATQLSFGTATSGSVNYTWQELSPGSATGSGSWSGAGLTISGLPTGATIRLQIAPTNFQRININNGGDRNRLTLVEQWGSTAWTDMSGAFFGCANLQVTATDVPNLLGVTNMAGMFAECTNLNSPTNINTWNTAAVTNMSFMFDRARAFNQNIGAWNTASVTTMQQMFYQASAFNQNIGSWNTGAVTNMAVMFNEATAFNQNIGAWNTASVTLMSFMFADAISFNQNISSWNTAAVTGMNTMFDGAIAFNQNIGAWTLNPAVNLSNMFNNSGMDCNNYSSTLIGWNVNPSTPNGRSLGATGRQYGTNAVAARTNLTTTKGWTITGDSPSGSDCSLAGNDFITVWNLATPGSGPTQLSFVARGSGVVNYIWEEISPGSATGSGSWTGAGLTISGLPSGSIIRLKIAPTNFEKLVLGEVGSLDNNRLLLVENWGSTSWTTLEFAFSQCPNLQISATDIPDLTNVTSMMQMFWGCTALNSPSNIGSWNTASVTNMHRMFQQATSFNQDLSPWNTTAVTDMRFMFFQASAFNQNIGSWNMSSVTNMEGMFRQASSFNNGGNGSINNWSTNAVTSMRSMFFQASSFNQNIGGWNTELVTNMEFMFSNASVFNQNIGSWNTAMVTNMGAMFNNATAFNNAGNGSINNWNTSNVIAMNSMFQQATAFNQSIDAWSIDGVTTMLGMFYQATAFNQNIGTWTLNPALNMGLMLEGSGLDCDNYSATLIGWSLNPSTPNGRTLGAAGMQYGTNAVAARTNLTTTKGWTITGDSPSGSVCAPPVLIPTISSFTPISGPIGTAVAITGTNFDPTPANNIVYFGATRATVTAATSIQLTVTVPPGATYQPITVSVGGFSSNSSSPFGVTYCNPSGITASSFTTAIDFTTGTSSGPVSIAIGDFDGDGKSDLAVANRFGNSVSVFRNTSSGTGNINYAAKIDLATGFEPVSISAGDLDGDGKMDLAVAIFGEFKVSVFRNISSGPGNISFAPPIDFITGSAGAGPFSVAVGDLDKDGKTDLAVANFLSNQASVLRNISSGAGNINFAARIDFPTGAGSGPYSISIGDIDLDGKLDLATSNANGNSVSVFRNTSSGSGIVSFATKVDFSTGTTPRSVVMGDLDGDLKLDLAVTAQTPNLVSIFRNTSIAGTISFAARLDFTTGFSPWFVAMGDLDGDGKVDLATANEGGQDVSVLRNVSTGVGNINFSPKVDFNGSGSSSVAVSLGDLDNDGKTDLIAAQFNSDFISVFPNSQVCTLAPTITSFTPASGPIGTTVTITGTNFDTTPANNTVMFNGITAVVTASSATSITTVVPSGATTGAITVTVGGNTATSATDFIVTSPGSLTITSFTPSSGPVGTTVMITGTNFDPTPSNNSVSFNGTTTTVTSASATSLTVSVPTGATTGAITVTVAGNTATSATDFSVTTNGNQPPIFNATQTTVPITGTTTIDLTTLISDPDNNLDLTTLTIVSPPISGANAQLDNGILLIDYSGIAFVGSDQLTIQVCDLLGSCTQQQITINVVDSNTGELIVYTGISPNGDFKNDIWVIENIQSLSDTQENRVFIYNRWGDLIFEVENYDNDQRVFKGINKNGNEVPSGVYFYKIEFGSVRPSLTGYLAIKR